MFVPCNQILKKSPSRVIFEFAKIGSDFQFRPTVVWVEVLGILCQHSRLEEWGQHQRRQQYCECGSIHSFIGWMIVEP